MTSSSARDWMYKIDTQAFYDGIDEFIKHADSFIRTRGISDGTINCPCTRCNHKVWKKK